MTQNEYIGACEPPTTLTILRPKKTLCSTDPRDSDFRQLVELFYPFPIIFFLSKLAKKLKEKDPEK